MLVWELFEDEIDLVGRMRQDIVTMLIPLTAHKVPFVTIQAIIDKLRERHTGIEIDRNLVMDVVDPMKMKIISKIEGDRVYFAPPEEEERKVSDQEQQREENKIASDAQKQAVKSVKG